MTATRYEFKDTDRRGWVVFPGDPAHPLCDALAKLGWEPRLPSSVVRRGIVTGEDIADADAEVLALSEGAEGADLDEVLLAANTTLRQLAFLAGHRGRG